MNTVQNYDSRKRSMRHKRFITTAEIEQREIGEII